MTDFEEFGLHGPVLEAIKKMGFVEASPIQKKAIPLILEGKDLLGQAQTGTGKTAAFGIPMAQNLAADASSVQALVLCPTRELAVQVAEELHELCLFTGHKVLPVYGGQRIDRQITALRKGVQIVVGTPGRILDHLGRRTLDLSAVKMLVLDEADMMLDMGFLPDIRRIVRQCATQRQTLLFSATIPDDIRRISQEYMRDPEWVSVVPETLTLEETEQIFYEVPEEEKIDALMRLLDYEDEGGTAIIFCRTRRNVDKLTRKLQSRGYDVQGLHGDLTQQQRDHIMQGFRDEKFPYLVATDVASRGLDISHVARVINFHIPQDPEAYVHRIGRTGRMGRSGVAVTFVTPAEYWDLLRIQEFSMAQIEEGELPSPGEVEERRRASRGDLRARRRVLEADRAPGRGARGEEGEAGAEGGEDGSRVEGGAEEAIIELTPAGLTALAEAAEHATPGMLVPEAPSIEEAPRRRRGRAAKGSRPEPKETAEEPFFTLPPTGEDSTEAERRQRRYAMRDARKRIEATTADEAVREAARIEHEALLEAVHEEALVESPAGEADEAERRVAEESEARQRAAAQAARRAEVAERLREAMLAAEAAASGRIPQPEAAAETAVEPEEAIEEEEAPLLEPQEERRIRRALKLRVQVDQLVSELDQDGLEDFLAIVARLEMDHDIRRVTAALIKELAFRQGDLVEEAPREEMTRLFISIGRRARVDRADLNRLVRETAGIAEEDIGRIDLLHNFAFVEVRKSVADKVVENMHESIFRGREISVEPARSGGKGHATEA